MPSIHDNHILRYSVDAKKRQIVIETEFPHSSPPELTKVIFEKVQAYLFENDLMGTIIFDIEETEISEITNRYRDNFHEGKKWGWPLGWQERMGPVEDYFHDLGLKAFELSSSYGMSGWVICTEMRYQND